MKKMLGGLLAITGIAFLIPILLTQKFEKKEVMQNMTAEITKPEEKEPYTYSQYGTIRLFHSKTNEIEELPIDEYLYGVVSAEMPAHYEMEALKAQAVVARTYTIYKIANQAFKHENADVCDEASCCQAWISKEDRQKRWEDDKKDEYWNRIITCVKETQGKVILYEGKPINAFFHANSGGSTEIPLNVWGGSGYPYLQTVTTAGEDAYDQYQSEAEFTKEQLGELVQQIHSDFVIDWNQSDCIQILERTNGNRVKKIKIGNLTLTGTEVRNIFKLRSANFEVSFVEDKVKFQVIGYGHGVGMSQTGADSLAKEGKSYADIIHHFYSGVEIKDL